MGWQELASKKQEEQFAAIPPEWRLSQSFIDGLDLHGGARLIDNDVVRKCGVLSDDEISITNATAKQLLSKLADRSRTSLEVTTAFCKRAAIAQQLTHCLTEIFFAEALERAKALDQAISQNNPLVGPLHGLPISLKDSFGVKGVATTLGWTSWLDNGPEAANSALVDVLLGLGAVLYCKTNIPQTMMTADSENNVFRRTLNPHNTALTAGGSSGGEGALVAFRGSILGVGTDVAGSIRIPSLCCGTYGFKPSTDRVPWGGQTSGLMQGLPGIKPSAGPLAHSLDDIELFMRAVLDSSPENYDPTVHAVGWRDVQVAKQLTFGVIAEDPSFPLHPPIKRGLQSTIAALEKAGHNLVRLTSEECRIGDASRLSAQSFSSVPGKEDHFTGPNAEPKIKSLAQYANPFLSGPPFVDGELEVLPKFEQLHKLRMEMMKDWNNMWVKYGLDAVVGPAAQCGPVAHDTFGWPPYTVVYNVLDYPACVIPTGQASAEEDPEEFEVPGDRQPNYHPKEVDGTPVVIQVATRRFQDEKCIQVGRMVEEALRAT